MRFVKLLLLIAALYLCAPIGASRAQLKSQVLGYRVEPVKVGDQFIYSITEAQSSTRAKPGKRKTATKRWRLVEHVVSTDATYENKTGARKLLRDTVTGESVYYVETPGVSFSMNEPSALSPMRTGGQWRTYPLSILHGKAITLPESEQVIDLGSSKSSTKTSASLRIIGKEKIKVGKSLYSCIKIRETITMESKTMPVPDTKGMVKKPVVAKTSKEIRIATLWYSPQLQTLVKYTTSQGNRSFGQSLVKYVKAPAQTAMLQKK